MPLVLPCTFPFPDQSPPAEIPHPCVQCPNADRAVLDRHAEIGRDDPELLDALRSFASWFFAPGASRDVVDQHVRYAAELYTRPDHDGTCIPKTILFAYYKWIQLDTYGAPPLSDAARTALKGLPVPSWPDGVERSGATWNELFAGYSRGYD